MPMFLWKWKYWVIDRPWDRRHFQLSSKAESRVCLTSNVREAQEDLVEGSKVVSGGF